MSGHQRVISFSGGLGSFAAADRVIREHGTAGVTLLFTDTKSEDADLYRFLDDAERAFGIPVTRIADGRDIWQVFRDVRYLGNTRVDPCSAVLKRELFSRWLSEHCDPTNTTVYVGIDKNEEHRFTRMQSRHAEAGWTYEAPLCQAPYLTRDDMLALLAEYGVAVPRLYTLGMKHNNCGGGCVKMGIAGFAHLLETLPEVYASWEQNEQGLRDLLDKNVSILRDRRGGTVAPLTLTQLRRRIQGGEAEVVPADEPVVSCNCFTPPCPDDVVDEELEQLMAVAV